MLDIHFIRNNPTVVADAAKKKNIAIDIDNLLAIDTKYRLSLTSLESLRAEKNQLTKRFSTAHDISQKHTLQQESTQLKEAIQLAEQNVISLKNEIDTILLTVPNIPSTLSPIGMDDTANSVVKRVGSVPTFNFSPRDHITLLELNDWADFGRVAKVSGSRTYALKGRLALLEQALLLYVTKKIAAKGFTPITVPSFARHSAFKNTGHFPAGQEDVFHVEKDEFYLTGTAEVILTSFHSNEILDEQQLPILYSGISPCFRREAGSAGRDVRGLMRVHQFNKVEQLVISKNDEIESERMHQLLLMNAQELLNDLELHYQVIECSTGDMGAGKFRQNDIEVWVPSFGGYRETHSCSTFHSWQARRANIRYRDREGNIHFVHTLNNTAIASPRIFVSLLENYQTAEGRVKIPDCLRHYFDNDLYL